MSALVKERKTANTDFQQFDDLISELNQYDFSDVAFRAGVSQSTLYNWVNGKVTGPHMRTFINVAKVIGFDIVLVRQSQRKTHILTVVK